MIDRYRDLEVIFQRDEYLYQRTDTLVINWFVAHWLHTRRLAHFARCAMLVN